MPLTLMHGDFTRHNTRQQAGRFVVFDWEFAREGSNPVADLLHFHLSRPTRMDVRATMRSALAQAARFASALFDGWRPAAGLSALALHSLIDTLLFYAVADGRLELRSFIVCRYLCLIEAKCSWKHWK